MNAFSTQLTSLFKRNLVTNRFFVFATVLAFLLVGVGKVGNGQVNMASTGSHTQNFNTLATSGTSNTWTDNSTISNWYSQRTGTGTTYAADAGTNTAGGLYSFGTGTNSDRSLGTLGSGNAAAGSFSHGVLLRNTSGSTITNITISYTLEEWRKSGVTTAQDITVWYKISSSAITSLNPNSNGTWTQITGLTLSSPINTSTAAALDGNAAANRVSASNVSIPSLSLANNDYIMIKWEDPDHTGTDHSLGIDDVVINWTVPAPACSAPSTQASNIIFPSVGATSMSVNWTNGSGAGRVIKMNTANSFTAPTDGSNPTANLTYAGSGEQVVFNGTGSGPITISGLSASTTYFFRVYEYCTTDRNYQTATATGNPNSQATSAGGSPILGISGTLSHGASCPTVPATSIQYTINNTGSVTADGINVSSNDAQFVVSGLSSTSIAAGGSATFNVTFTPASAGAKSATITVTSTTGGSNAPTASLTGTGTTPVSPVVTSLAATGVTNTTANLNGNLGTLGVCPATSEKGFVYSLTATNSNPTVGGSGVTKTAVSGLTTGDFTLALSSLPNLTGYSYKAYVYDGTTYTYGTTQTFTTLSTPCLSEDFTAGSLPSGWTQSTVTFGSLYADFSGTTGNLTTTVISNPNTLTFTLERTANPTDKTLLVEVSTTSQSSGFTTVATYTHANTTSGGITSCTVDLSAYTASPVVYVRFTKSASTTSPWRVDNVNIYCTPSPEINVRQGVTNLASGSGSYSFGTIVTGNSSSAVTFTVENTGSASLSLTGTPRVAISGHTSDFTINQTSTLASVSAAGSTTFTVTFNPTTTGTRTATISIANNDGNENPYTFTVTGIGNSPTAPEINLKQGVANIASGGSYAFGSQTAATSSAAVTFTIENTGNADLTLSGTPRVAISGTNAAEFTVDQTATTSPVGAASSTTFTITFSPTSTGAKSATITIANDDVDEGTYTFTLSGTGALATEPTAAPTSLVFSSVTNVGFNVSFTAASGSPTGYLVLRRSGSAPTGTPVDGTTYTLGQSNIGSGTNTVAYVGAFPSPNFLENTLAADTRYFYVVYSYNGTAAGTNYYTAATLAGNRFTLANEPTAQGAPSVTNIQPTSMQLTGFNSGNGASVIIVAKQGSAVDAPPIDGVNYSANATFGSGSPLGGGNFVVGINPTEPLTVTGLTPGVTYHFAAFDFNGTLANQSANFLTTNPGRANGGTPSNSSDIIVVGGSESATISSLTNIATISTSSEGTPVWQFTIRDGGGTSDADNLPTIVNTLVFTQNTGNQMDNFLNAIQSVALFNGTTLISNTPTITATQISFSGLGLVVPDGGSLTVTVRMSVKSNVNAGSSTGVNADGDDFVFQLTAGNQVTGSTTTSSQFVSTFSPVVASANGSNVYSVVATRLSFVQQPTEVNLNAAMSPAVTVSAEDAGGNRDVNYATDIVITSTGDLSGSPVTVSPTAGLATYNTLTHTSLGTSLQLTASSGSFTPVTSDPFNVTSGPSTLVAGDVAVLAMGVNSPDKIAIILLKDINAGTVIHITDNGMASATTGRTGEGFLTYTAPTAQCAGTILTWENGQNVTGTGWNSGAPTNFALNNSGDQIFVFQGSTSNWATQTGITLLYAFQTANTWITTGTATASNSYEPSALASQFKIQFTGLSETDVYYTSASVSGTSSAILTSLGSTANYTKQNTAFTMPSYTSALEVSNFSSSVFSTSCIGSGARVTVNSTVLESASYTVTYSLSGSNTGSNLTSSMSFTAGAPGTGTFTTASLSNAGATTITIHSVSLNGCALVTGSGNVVNTTVGNTNTWVGTTGNWTDAANWSCGVPTATQNISIPSGTVTLNTNYTLEAGNTFTLSGSASFIVAASRTFTIAGAADFGNRPVTIQSNASGAGAIGQITGSLTNATNVTVERYIPARRAWRMLTAPLTGTTNNSIFFNWQNNGTAGSGVNIWAPAPVGVATPSSSNSGILAGGVSSSVLQYNNGSNTWSAVTNTNTNTLFGAGNGSQKSYAIFVTGPFGTGSITGSAVATTLRANGTLQQGPVSYTGLANNQFHMIGNPYPAPVNLSLATVENTNGAFYVWDAKGGTFGIYRTWDGGEWVAAPTGSSYNDLPIVQSGQAFFIRAQGGDADIEFTEADKVTNANGNAGFRTYNTNDQKLRIRLNRIVNNVPEERDAALARFDASYHPKLDGGDIVKATNFSENLALVRSGINLVVERRSLLPNDTLFLNLSQTAATNYELEFSYDNFQLPAGTTVVLRDLFTNTERPLIAGTTEKISFAVTADAKSTGQRFQLVFRNNTVTPVRDLNGVRGFAVYPNPVPAGSPMQVEFRNRAAGTYHLVLYSSTGVQVLQRVVQHGGGTAVQPVDLPQQLPAGLYIAEFTDAKGGKQQLKINIQ